MKNCQSSKYDDQNLKSWEYIILYAKDDVCSFRAAEGSE